TYGDPRTVPMDESHPQNPVNVYGETKLQIERQIQWTSELCGLRAVMLRYFNAAGCDPDGEIGEDHDPETHLVPSAIGAALQMRPRLDVYGDDFSTPDGTPIR